MNRARGYARTRFCGRRCEGTQRVNCYRLSLNKTVGQARRLPIHRRQAGALALQIRYQRSVIGSQLVATACPPWVGRTVRWRICYLLSLPGESALTTWIKHGAAAICAATMACILSFDRARDRFVHLELIIVRQFFARADVA